MAFDAMPWRSSLLAQCRLVCMAATAQIVELALEKRPDVRVSGVAIHARTPSGIVVVIVVAKNAVLRRMIRVRE